MSVKFQLIEHDNSFHDNHWAIKLEEGVYKDVVYQYDTVSFEGGENEGDDVVLTFNTITLDNPDKLDLTSEDFEVIISDILTEIIEEQLENMNDEDGTGDTEASAE